MSGISDDNSFGELSVYQNVSNGVSGIRHRVNVFALWENVGNRVMSRQTFKKIAIVRPELH